MFIKPFSKYNKTTEKHYTIYQLCESYRLDGRTRHHLIIGLGKLEEKLHTVEEIKRLGKRIEEKLKGQNILKYAEKIGLGSQKYELISVE